MKKRVILKKTSYLKRSERGNSKRISKYLEQYIDEVGKALAKRGEAPWVKQTQTQKEPRWLLPKERTGVFYTGGFLGVGESPGNIEPNKQKGWVKRYTKNWIRTLEKHSNRRNDGFRFILGLSPEAVSQLTKCNISCDQAMREIWNTTIELYKERHGWTNPKDDIAWLAGAHHDTDNAHMHIMIFPTTKSGKILRTNNSRGKEKIDDLNDMIAMSNIASEIFWREMMPFEYQNKTFKKTLIESPEQEPSLPTISDFSLDSGLPGRRKSGKDQTSLDSLEKLEELDESENTMNWEDINPLDPEKKIEMELEYGKTTFVDKLRNNLKTLRGKLILIATATAAKVWEKKKIKFFPTLKDLESKTGADKSLGQIETSFPEDTQELDNLKEAANLIKKPKSKERLIDIIENKMERGHAIINLALGSKEDLSIPEVLNFSGRLAYNFDTSIKQNDSEEKLKTIQKETQNARQNKKNEDLRRLKYQSIRRSILYLKTILTGQGESQLIDKCLSIMKRMIEGSKSVSLTLEGRVLEAQSAIEEKNNKLIVRTEDREWDIAKQGDQYKVFVKQNKGKPWPPHLDPDTVLEPLKTQGIEKIERAIIKKTTSEKTEALGDTSQKVDKTSIEPTNPIEVIIFSKNRRSKRRREEAKEKMREYRQLRLPDDTDADEPSIEIK